MRFAALAVAASTVFVVTQARADVAAPTRSPKRNAVSTQPLALLGDGAMLQYESFAFPRPRVSIATSLGARAAASGDFSAFTLANGGEVRFWILGEIRGSGQPRGSMVGPYVFGRLDASLTNVHRSGGGRVGGTIELAETGGVGVRWVALQRIEITPYLGLGALTSFDASGRLSPYSRPILKSGFFVGVLF